MLAGWMDGWMDMERMREGGRRAQATKQRLVIRFHGRFSPTNANERERERAIPMGATDRKKERSRPRSRESRLPSSCRNRMQSEKAENRPHVSVRTEEEAGQGDLQHCRRRCRLWKYILRATLGKAELVKASGHKGGARVHRSMI